MWTGLVVRAQTALSFSSSEKEVSKSGKRMPVKEEANEEEDVQAPPLVWV